MQAVLILSLLLSFFLIAQQYSQTLYQIGLLLLIVSTFLEIAFGNIPPNATFWPSMKLLGITMVIVVVVFTVSIYVAPYLVGLGR